MKSRNYERVEKVRGFLSKLIVKLKYIRIFLAIETIISFLGFLISVGLSPLQLFQRCLIKILNIDLWKLYLQYVRETKSSLPSYK